MKECEFENAPSREELEKSIETIGEIIDSKKRGYEISIVNGVAWAVQQDKSEWLGKISDVSVLRDEFFGEDNPDPAGVEYYKLDGITIMTYYGHVIACGVDSDLLDSDAEKLVYDLNDLVHAEVSTYAGSIWDVTREAVGKGSLFSGLAMAMTLVEAVVRVATDSNVNNYDDTVEILANLTSIFDPGPGSGAVVRTYSQMVLTYTLEKFVLDFQLNFGEHNDLILDDAAEIREDVVIEWEEDVTSGSITETSGRTRLVGNVGLSEAQWATIVYKFCEEEEGNCEGTSPNGGTSSNGGNSGDGSSTGNGNSSGDDGSGDDESSGDDGDSSGNGNSGNSSSSGSRLPDIPNHGQVAPDKSAIETAGRKQIVDPLIIDLNQNGLFTTSVANGTYFDYKEDGWKEKTAWADAGDGFLVYDRNEDGVIGNAGELFGNRTLLEDGTYADDGFIALAEFDANADGVINGSDEIFSKLSIWQDKNGNGVTDEGELHSLESMGIVGVGLSTSEESYTDENGNVVIKESAVSMADGTSIAVGALGFDTDSMDTKMEQEIEVSEHIASFMPNLEGSGNVLTLHQAMESNFKLYNLVVDFMQTKDSAELNVIAEQILIEWAGCGDVEAGSRGICIDATHLEVIEAFYGKPYNGVAGTKPVRNSAKILESVYQKMVLDTKSALLTQSYFPLCAIYAPIQKDEETDTYSCNLLNLVTSVNSFIEDSQLVYDIISSYARYAVETGVPYEVLNVEEVNVKLEEIGFGTVDTLLGNTMIRGGDSLMVSGTRIADSIYGGNVGTTMFGGEGDDKIYGAAKDDTLIGGDGDDYLSGAGGADTYIYNRGDGHDRISNVDVSAGWGSDRLLFGEGIRVEDIQVKRDGNDMVLEDIVSGGTVTVVNAYGKERNFLCNVEFTDGTAWSMDDLLAKAQVHYDADESSGISGKAAAYGYSVDETFYMGGGDDYVTAATGNDVVYGEAGNDKLYGGAGNDILVGGIGDDWLQGDGGVDTYIYNRGDGNDTIYNNDGSSDRINDRLQFGEGILAEEISCHRENNSLILTDTITGAAITISNAFNSRNQYMENIEFADGTIWNMEYLQERLTTIYGSDGADTLKGWSTTYGYSEAETFRAGDGDDKVTGVDGDDVLYGEAGNDTLNGGNGSDILVGGVGDDYLDGSYGVDTYIYNRGDGNDTINVLSISEKDKLVFGEGISAEDITIERQGNNMVLTDTVTGGTVTVKNAYTYEAGFIEDISFADGTAWTLEDLQEKVSVVRGSDAADSIYSSNSAYGFPGNDTFYMGAGNDTVFGRDGVDILYGEDGADKLYGEAGDDILVGGLGNDTLTGGAGNDTYIFNRGDGSDYINNYATSDDIETLQLGVNASEVVFSKEINNLLISVLDSDDNMDVSSWFKNEQYQFDYIQTSDGYTLAGAQVAQLIQAMSSFESTSGLSWEDAARAQNEDYMSIVQQYWTKQVG